MGRWSGTYLTAHHNPHPLLNCVESPVFQTATFSSGALYVTERSAPTSQSAMTPLWVPALAYKPLLLLVWCLIGTSVAQYDPLQDFCRRWGHQSAVVDRRLYIDGGLINYKPFSSSSQNMSSIFPSPAVDEKAPTRMQIPSSHTMTSIPYHLGACPRCTRTSPRTRRFRT